MNALDNQKESDFWSVSARTIQRWKASGRPVHDRLAMAKFLITQSRSHVSQETRLVAKTVLDNPQPYIPHPVKNESVSPQKSQQSAQPPRITPSREIDFDSLKEFDESETLDRAEKLLAEAYRDGNQGDITYYEDRVEWLRAEQRKRELHAEKMGRKEGEILSKDEISSLIYALAFWFNAASEQAADALSSKIIGIDLEEVAQTVLANYFAENFLLGVFSKASRVQCGVRLPGWVTEAIEDSITCFVMPGDNEQDEVAFQKHMDAIRASTLPAT